MAHILLVEDDILLSEMYQQALISEGHTCATAHDGAIGLSLALSTKPDLVLLDLMLPQMSGDEVLANMRQSEACKDTKVIIMTNISKSEAPEIIDTLAFERYIVKANTSLNDVVKIVNDLFPVAKHTA